MAEKVQIPIRISVRDLIATQIGETEIVCNNDCYYLEFDFDSMWDQYNAKTVRINYNGIKVEVPFFGNVCSLAKVPLSDTTLCEIGVFAGDIQTTTPAYVRCKKSILCKGGLPKPPENNVYSEILSLCEDAVETSKSVEEKANRGEFNGEVGPIGPQGPQGPQGNPGNDGYTPVKGKDYFTPAEVNDIRNGLVKQTDQTGYRVAYVNDRGKDNTMQVVNNVNGTGGFSGHTIACRQPNGCLTVNDAVGAFDAINKRTFDETVRDIKILENGQGAESVQIKGGNATGEGAVALSKKVELPSTQSDILTKDTLKVGASVTSLDAHDYQFIISNERWFDGEMHVTLSNGSHIYISPGWISYILNGDRLAYISYYGDNVGFPIEFDEPTVVESIDCSSVYIPGPDGDEEISICDFITFKTDDIPEPEFTETKGDYSLSAGVGTSTTNEGEFAAGRFNKTSPNTLFSVGNGTVEKPSNAFEVTEEGEVFGGGKKLATEAYVSGKAGALYLSFAVGVDSNGEGFALFCNHIPVPNPSIFSNYGSPIKPEHEPYGDYRESDLEVRCNLYPDGLLVQQTDLLVYLNGTYTDTYDEFHELTDKLFRLSYLPPDEYESILSSYSYWEYAGSGYYTVYN